MSNTSSSSRAVHTRRGIREQVGTVLVLALALVSLLPGLAAAKIAANHSQTILRAGASRKHLGTVIALGFALVAMLPALAAAKIAGNHNLTLLRD